MSKKLTHKQIEKANKANVLETLAALIENHWGAVYPVEDGLAIPIGESPLDGKQMWVVVDVTAKTIQEHKWGKGVRKYYNGYEEAEAFQLTLKEKAEKEAIAKENKEKRLKK